jgi:tRNA(His) 5'-end guanylyltransferase
MGRFDKDSLGNRMKKYEDVYKQNLVPNMPVVLRIDGKAFHTFTKKMKKPFDDLLINTMQKTMVSLCSDIQGAKFGYTQSDEITIVIKLDDIRSQMFFDGKVQKILSITASKATKYFNKHFYDNVNLLKSGKSDFENVVELNIYENKLFQAEFDCRVMNIPEGDLINNLIWRQMDATRNSISTLAQANFSHSELQGKSSSDMMDMLVNIKNINWNDLAVYKKRGSCCYKVKVGIRRKWLLNKEMPILTENRTFFENIVSPKIEE